MNTRSNALGESPEVRRFLAGHLVARQREGDAVADKGQGFRGIRRSRGSTAALAADCSRMFICSGAGIALIIYPGGLGFADFNGPSRAAWSTKRGPVARLHDVGDFAKKFQRRLSGPDLTHIPLKPRMSRNATAPVFIAISAQGGGSRRPGLLATSRRDRFRSHSGSSWARRRRS